MVPAADICRAAQSTDLDRIVAVPHGDTKGNAPVFNGSRYLTDLPGSWGDATRFFASLLLLADQPELVLVTSNPLELARGVIAVSRDPITGRQGAVQLRFGINKKTGEISPRIDIQANAIHLSKPETIHFTGGEGVNCPTI